VQRVHARVAPDMSIQALQQIRDSLISANKRIAQLEAEAIEFRRRLDAITRPIITAKPQQPQKPQ
jgi:hypothetical protein